MSPYELTILLHHHVSPEPFKYEHQDLYKQTVEFFKQIGLLRVASAGHYETTPVCNAWLSRLLSAPYPERYERWIDPASGDVLMETTDSVVDVSEIEGQPVRAVK